MDNRVKKRILSTWRNTDIRKSFCRLVIACALGVFVLKLCGYTQSESGEGPEVHLQRVKDLHKFNEWAGSVKIPGMKIEKLALKEEDFRQYGAIKISTPEELRDKKLNVKILGDPETGDVLVWIRPQASPLAAQESLMQSIALATAPLPNYKKAEKGSKNDVGDVCFYPVRVWIPKETSQPVIRRLYFTRNNVLVCIINDHEGKSHYLDTLKLAIFIDEKLIKQLQPPYAAVSAYQIAEGETLRKGHYVLKRSPVPRVFVTGIDVKVLAKRHLQDFEFIRQGMVWNWGRQYVFLRPTDASKVEITAAVYSSVQETEENVLDLLNSWSGMSEKGTPSGIVIGENCWFLRTGQSKAGTITFIRKNVLVNVFSSSYELAEITAKKIDQDIMAEAPGIRTGASVTPPLINEIVTPAKAKKGEPIEILINATDPAGEKLSYAVISSSGKISSTEVENRKIFLAETSGIYKLSVCVANESNVFSKVGTVQIGVE